MIPRSWTSWLSRLSPTQFIVLGYLITITLSTLLLALPISRKSSEPLTWLDTLFTATSGVTVTGLTVVNTADTYTWFGHLILLLTFQVGGIGIMALGTFVWIILGRNISLSYRRLLMIDQNRNNLSGLVKLAKILIGLALLIESAGAVMFTAYFYVTQRADSLSEALYYGVFHAVSAYTNAGFDIFGNSLTDFSTDYFVQFVSIVLISLGAIGFPVLVEVREYLFGKHKHFRFSLFTKITSLMFFLLLVIGSVGIWLIERDLYFSGMPWHQQVAASLFHSVTTRSGGLATMDVTQFSVPSQFLSSLLMFIGASPSSAGGGIRTTTFALIILALITFATGKVDVRAFRRSIKQEDVMKSFVVFTAAVMIVSGSIILLDIVEQNHNLVSIIFEVSSAFGTCGLSTGITQDLSGLGKAIIMVLMFIGRIGIVSLLFMFQSKKRKEAFHYPKEDMIIG